MGSTRFMLSDHAAHLTLAGYRPRTIRARREVIRQFEAFIHPLSLRSATRRHVEQFLSRPLSASSRHTYLGHLRGLYRWALEEGHVKDDPTAKVGKIRVKPGVPRPITQDELALALDHAPPRMRAWLLLFAFAGLRCMEVAYLRPCDLLQADTGPLLFLRETKGGGQAHLPCHRAIVDALTVLPIRNNLWWDLLPNTVSTDTSEFLHGLGIEASAHRLRHLAATVWYRTSGEDLLTTASLMRHAQVNTTMVYSRIDPARPAEVVNLVTLPPPPGPVQLRLEAG